MARAVHHDSAEGDGDEEGGGVEVGSRMYVGPELALAPREVDEELAGAGLTLKQRNVMLLTALEFEPVEIAETLSGKAVEPETETTDQRVQILDAVDTLARPWRGGSGVSRQYVAKTLQVARRKLQKHRDNYFRTEEVSMESPSTQQYVTVAQAAREFNTTEAAIRNRMVRGQFNVRKAGYARLLDREEVARVLARSAR